MISFIHPVGFHPHDAKDFTEDIFNQDKGMDNIPPSPLYKGWGDSKEGGQRLLP